MNDGFITDEDLEAALRWQRQQSPKDYFEDLIRRGS
jgi:hypothetical protein